MMNLRGWAGGAPDWWYDYRTELSGKFNERLQSFGVGIVNPGFVGMVPDNFCKYFPVSKILNQGKWLGYSRPGFLLPDDCNYEKIANLYYNELKEIKGGNHVRYYSADPFHEGGIRDGIDIGNYALENFHKMQEHSENAVWVLQEWGELKPEITQSIPDDGMLMLSLTTDRKNPDEEYASECPWCYCAVNYYGGQYYLHGAANEELINPFKHLKNTSSKLVGIGYMPESVNCGEIIYSIFSKNDNFGGESGLCAHPSLDVCRVSSRGKEAMP